MTRKIRMKVIKKNYKPEPPIIWITKSIPREVPPSEDISPIMRLESDNDTQTTHEST